MLLGEEHSFRNRELHIEWKGDTEADAVQSANQTVQSANSALYLLPKGQNCTLEEVAVLRVVQMKPTATQKEIAAEIGKSERTVKSLTIALQEKGVLKRVGSKRDGRWEIITE